MIYSRPIKYEELKIVDMQRGQAVTWSCPHCHLVNDSEYCKCGAKLALLVQKDYNERNNPKTRAFNI